MASTSTIDGIARIEEATSAHVARRRRWLHRCVWVVLVAVMGAAVLDGADVVELLGPDERSSQVSSHGFTLEVEHPSVTRAALPAVFHIRITHEGGFDEPIQVGVTRDYLEAFDLNGVLPAPSGEVAGGRWIVWEFDPPIGDELLITYEARIEPGVQLERAGEVALFADDEPILRTRISTAVRP